MLELSQFWNKFVKYVELTAPCPYPIFLWITGRAHISSLGELPIFEIAEDKINPILIYSHFYLVKGHLWSSIVFNVIEFLQNNKCWNYWLQTAFWLNTFFS